MWTTYNQTKNSSEVAQETKVNELPTQEAQEALMIDQTLKDLNKLLDDLIKYKETLINQKKDVSEIDKKIAQLQKDKTKLENGNDNSDKKEIARRVNEEIKNLQISVQSTNIESKKQPSSLQKELIAYFDKPEKHNQVVAINGKEYTVSQVLEKGWINDGKDGPITKILRDIMYNETGRSVSEKTQSAEDREASKDFLKNFQEEASLAFKKEIVDKNGIIQVTKFKEAFEYIAELGDLQNVVAEKGKFEWLDANEKKELLKQMPAVHGIVGSIMTKTLFDSGYKFAFNGDNTVVVQPKNGNAQQDKEIEKALNDAIARNSGIVPILKAGLLYQDQDLLKYLQLRADSTGKNISADAQKPEAFLEYLKNPGRGVQSSDAAQAIMNSKNFFEGMDLDSHMKAVSYVPSLSSSLQVVMNNPEVQQAMRQSGQNVSDISNAPSNAYSSGSIAFMGQNFWNANHSKGVPTISQDIKQEGLIGGILKQTGHTGVLGLKEIFNSRESTMVAVLAIIGSFFYFGFKKTILGMMAAPFVTGTISRLMDDFKWKTNKETSSVRDATKEEREQAAQDVYNNPEQANAAITATEPLKNANPEEVKKYIAWDANANLTDDQKKHLDTLKDDGKQEIVSNHIDILRKEVADKFIKNANPPFTEEWLQLMNEFINSQSISQLEVLKVENDEQIRQRILDFLKEDGNGFGIAEIRNELWEFIKENPWISAVTLLVVIFVLRKLLLSGMYTGIDALGRALIIVGWKALGNKWKDFAKKRKEKLKNSNNNSDAPNNPNTPNNDPNRPNDNPVPERGQKGRADYQNELEIYATEQENIKKNSKRFWLNTKESKEADKKLKEAESKINAMKGIDQKRPFDAANEATRHEFREKLNKVKDLEIQKTNLETEIVQLNNELAWLTPNSKKARQKRVEKNTKETTKTRVEGEIRTLNAELNAWNPAHWDAPKIKVGGSDKTLIPRQAVEYDEALKNLEKYDGKHIFWLSQNHRGTLDQAALDDIKKSLTTIYAIRWGATPLPLPTDFDTIFFETVENGAKSAFSVKKLLQQLI